MDAEANGLADLRRRLVAAPAPQLITAAVGRGAPPPERAGDAVSAAVLVGLVDRPGAPTVLLTRRARNLDRHPGQVGFSGGIVEAGDEDDVACALRETEEEIGLDRGSVGVFARLDHCLTGTGYRVMPVVGRVDPDHRLRPDPREVDDVFEVPLAFVLDPRNHARNSMETPDGVRHFYDFRWEGRRIWGATARMLVNLYERSRA